MFSVAARYVPRRSVQSNPGEQHPALSARLRKFLVGALTVGLVATGLTIAAAPAHAATTSVEYCSNADCSQTTTVTADVMTTANNGTGLLAGSWWVCDSTLSLSNGLLVAGSTANLILAQGCNLSITGSSGYYGAALAVPSGRTLNVYATPDNTGRLSAIGAAHYAGIGAGAQSYSSTPSGTINLYGGYINATSNTAGAGIGSSNNPSGPINILWQANVQAYGGVHQPSTPARGGGAGIGSGGSNNDTPLPNGTITINTTGMVRAFGGGGGTGGTANIGYGSPIGGGGGVNMAGGATTGTVTVSTPTYSPTGSATSQYRLFTGAWSTAGAMSNVAVGSTVTYRVIPTAPRNVVGAKGNNVAMKPLGGDQSTGYLYGHKIATVTSPQPIAFTSQYGTKIDLVASPSAQQTRPGDVTFTATLRDAATNEGLANRPLTLTVTGGPGGSYSLTTDANGVASKTFTSPAVSTFTVNASYAGTVDWAVSSASITDYKVVRAAHTVTGLGLQPQVTYGDGPVTVSSSSVKSTTVDPTGLWSVVSSDPVVGSVSNVATDGDGVVSGTVTFNKAGTFTVTASRAQDDNYLVGSTSSAVTVSEAQPQLSLTHSATTTTAEPITLTMTIPKRGSGRVPEGTVAFYLDSVLLDTVTLTDDGNGNAVAQLSDVYPTSPTVNVEAVFSGDAGRYAAGTVTSSWDVEKANQGPLAIADPGAKTFGDDRFTFGLDPEAEGSGTGELTWEVLPGGEGVLSVDPDTGEAQIIGGGQVTVKVTRAEDGAFNAKSATFTFTVAAFDLANLTSGQVTLAGGPFTYQAAQIRPGVSASFVGADGVTHDLVLSTDFSVSYGANVNAGTGAGSAVLQASAGANYSGSKTVAFDILKAQPQLMMHLLENGAPVTTATLPAGVAVGATFVGVGTDVQGKDIVFTQTAGASWNRDGTAATNADGVAATAEVANPSAGTYSFTGEFAGDANYLPITAVSLTDVVVQRGTAHLTLEGVNSSQTYGDGPFTVALAGLPESATGAISYVSSDPTVASLGGANGDELTIHRAGTFTVTGQLAADSLWDAAETAPFTVTVSEATTSLELSYTGGGSTTAPIVLTAALGKPAGAEEPFAGTVTFTEGEVVVGTGTISNGVATLTITNPTPGDHTYLASFPGQTGFYTAATSNEVTVSTEKTPQPDFAIIAPSAADTIYGGPMFGPLNLAGKLGTGAVTWSVPEDNGVVDIDPETGEITILAAGNVTVTADLAADSIYEGATATYSLTISPRDLSTVDVTLAGAPFTYTAAQIAPTPTATFTSGASTVTVDPAAYTVSFGANVLVATGGSVTLTADSPNYTGTKTVNFAIQKAQPSLSLTAISDSAAVTELGLPGSFNLETSFTGVGGDIDAKSITFAQTAGTPIDLGAGVNTNAQGVASSATVTNPPHGLHDFTATFAGDANYFAASVSLTGFDVTRATQTVSIAGVGATQLYGAGPFTLSLAGKQGTGAVTFTSSDPTVAKVEGTTLTILKAGTFTLNGSIAADAIYDAATAPAFTVTVSESTPTVALSFTGGETTTTPVVLTAQLTKPAGASEAFAGTVTFYEGAAVVGTGTINASGVATVTLSAPSPGDHTYLATFPGQTGFYTVATSNEVTVSVGKTPQPDFAIIAPSAADTIYGGPVFGPLNLAGKLGTGAVTWSVPAGNGVVDIDPDTGEITILAAGNVTVTAHLAADSVYGAATATYSLTISPRDLSTVDVTLAGAPFTYTAAQITPTATVTFASGASTVTIDPAAYTVSYGANVNVATGGTVTLTAVSPNFTGTQTVNFTIEKAQPSLTATARSGGVAVTGLELPGAFDLQAQFTGVGSDVQFKAIDFTQTAGDPVDLGTGAQTNATGVATSAAVTNPAHGSYAFTVSFAGDANYLPVSVPVTGFEVTRAAQTVSIAGVGATQLYGAGPFTLSLAGKQGTGAVTFTSSDETVATVNGATLTILKAGSFTLNGSIAADAIYDAATASPFTVTVAESTPTVALSATGGETTTTPVVLTAQLTKPTGASEPLAGTVTFTEGGVTVGTGTINASGVATVTLTSPTPGDHTYVATFPGQTGFYTVATSNEVTVSVGKSPQPDFAIIAPSAADTIYGGPVFGPLNLAGKLGTGAVTWSVPVGNGVVDIDSATGEITILAAGTVTVTADLAADAVYAGATATYSLTISPRDLSTVDVTLAGAPFTYTAAQIAPTPTATFVSGASTVTVDPAAYTVSFGANVLVATGGSVTLTADSPNFTGTKTVNFAIQKAQPSLSLTAKSDSAAVTALELPGSFTLETVFTGVGADLAAKPVEFTQTAGGSVDLGTGAVTNTSGVASSATVANPPYGSHDFTASFAGDANYFAATVSITGFEVTRGTQSVSIAGVTASQLYGAGPFTLSLAGKQGTGAVTFTSSDETVATVNGATLTILKAGSFTLNGSVAADAIYDAAIAAPFTVTVAESTPTVALSATGGETTTTPVVLTAQLTKPTGASEPLAGTVTFTEGGVTVGTGTINASGVATVTLSAPSPGDHTYLATFPGQTGFYTVATSNEVTVSVGKTPQPDFAIIAPSAADTIYGGPVFGPLNLAGKLGTGAVTWSVPAGNGVVNVDPDTGEITILNAGTVTVTAQIASDPVYGAATATYALTISPRDLSTVSVTLAGGPFTYTAAQITPTPAATFMSGAVTVTVDPAAYTVSYGANVNVATGGTVTLTALSPNYSGAKSVNFTILKAQPSLTLAAISGGVQVGSLTLPGAFQLQAAFTGVGGDVSGKPLTFTQTAGTASLDLGAGANTNGAGLAASSTVTNPAHDSYSFTVSFAGNANYEPAQANLTGFTVNRADQNVTVTGVAASQVYGAGPFTLALAGKQGTGNVTFTSSDTSVGQVSGATLTILKVGTFTVTGQVAADAIYNEATSPAFTVTVTEATPLVTLTHTGGTSTTDALILSAQLTKPSGATKAFTGTVTFMEGATEVGTGTVNAAGVATVTITNPIRGSHTYTATFPGQTGFYTQASSLTHQVIIPGVAQPDFKILDPAVSDAVYGNTAGFTLLNGGVLGTGAITWSVPAGNGVLTVNPATGEATILAAGSVTVTSQIAQDGTYDAATATRVITIAKRAVTVTADAQEMQFGDPVPAFTWTENPPLVPGDSLGGSLKLAGPLTLGVNQIVQDVSFANSNYQVTFVPGTLTVTPTAAQQEVMDLVEEFPLPVRTREDADQVAAAATVYRTLSEAERDALPAPVRDSLTTAQTQAGIVNHSDAEVGAIATSAALPWEVRLEIVLKPVEDDQFAAFQNKLDAGRSLITLYDIHFVNTITGETWQPPVGYTVEIELSKVQLNGYTNIGVSHQLVSGALETVPSSLDGTRIQFSGTSFSLYGITGVKPGGGGGGLPGTGAEGVGGMLFGAITSLMVGAGVLFAAAGLRRRRQDDTA